MASVQASHTVPWTEISLVLFEKRQHVDFSTSLPSANMPSLQSEKEKTHCSPEMRGPWTCSQGLSEFQRRSVPRDNKKCSIRAGLTLPETNSSHLKMGHPKKKLVFLPSVFRCYVSLREGNPCMCFWWFGEVMSCNPSNGIFFRAAIPLRSWRIPHSKAAAIGTFWHKHAHGSLVAKIWNSLKLETGKQLHIASSLRISW